MLTEEDLILMQYIMNRVKVIGIHVMKNHMNKLKRLTDYMVSYVV